MLKPSEGPFQSQELDTLLLELTLLWLGIEFILAETAENFLDMFLMTFKRSREHKYYKDVQVVFKDVVNEMLLKEARWGSQGLCVELGCLLPAY